MPHLLMATESVTWPLVVLPIVLAATGPLLRDVIVLAYRHRHNLQRFASSLTRVFRTQRDAVADVLKRPTPELGVTLAAPHTPAAWNRAARQLSCLVAITLVLAVIGIVYTLLTAPETWARLMIWVSVGAVGSMAVLRASLRQLRTWMPNAVLSLMVFLLVDLALGKPTYGARLYLPPPLDFVSPGTFAPPVFAAWTAAILTNRHGELRPATRRTIVAMAGVLGTLLLAEPYLAMALAVIAVLAAALGFVLRSRLDALTTMAVTAAAIGGLAWLEPYRYARARVFLDPARDSMGAAWELRVDLHSLAAGRFIGRSDSTWATLIPLPHWTDVLPGIVVEWGRAPAAIVVIMMGLLAAAHVALFRSSRSPFVRAIIATGGASFFSLVGLNLVGVTDLAPMTGAPIPLLAANSSIFAASLMSFSITVAAVRAELRGSAPGEESGRGTAWIFR